MENIHRKLTSKSYSVSCELCSIGPLCIPMLINNNLESVLNRRVFYAKDRLLTTQGMPFDKLYVIHAGALKSYAIDDEQIEHIVGFYLPGDIVGLGNFSSNQCNYNIKALVDTQVCEVRREELMELVSSNTDIRDMLFNLMSTDIFNYKQVLINFSQKKADERLATFIYSLYTRYSKRGHVSPNMKLSMSRADIGNFLGLTIETISRIFTKLQDEGILTAKGKYIYIKNLNALINAANGK